MSDRGGGFDFISPVPFLTRVLRPVSHQQRHKGRPERPNTRTNVGDQRSNTCHSNVALFATSKHFSNPQHLQQIPPTSIVSLLCSTVLPHHARSFDISSLFRPNPIFWTCHGLWKRLMLLTGCRDWLVAAHVPQLFRAGPEVFHWRQNCGSTDYSLLCRRTSDQGVLMCGRQGGWHAVRFRGDHGRLREREWQGRLLLLGGKTG